MYDYKELSQKLVKGQEYILYVCAFDFFCVFLKYRAGFFYVQKQKTYLVKTF